MSPALASGFFTAAPPGKAIQGFYIILYCNKFIILFTQYFPTVKYLERRYSSTVEWLAFLSSTNYITAAFTLASGHPGLEIKILYYCTVKYTKHTTPCRGCTHVTMYPRHMN